MHVNSQLLTQVCYVSRQPKTEKDLTGAEIRVVHTFPYNPASRTAPNTAMQWAKMYCGSQTYEPIVLTRDNEPFSVKIIDLDFRGNGGRAYKVIDSEDRVFDLREDQIIEVFTHAGVLAGGAVNGQFVWGLAGSQVKLVLIGGDLHREMSENLAKLKAFTLRKKDASLPKASTLCPGKLYRRGEHVQLFIGRVRTPLTSKLMFAFINMPLKPWYREHYAHKGVDKERMTKYELAERDYVIAQNDVALRWDDMTWSERCKWTWVDGPSFEDKKYDVEPGHYGQFRAHIDILSSLPAFEEELPDEPSIDLVGEIIANEKLNFGYYSGVGDDLAVKHAEDEGDHEPVQYNYWERWHEADRRRRETERLDWRRNARLKFRNALVWGSGKTT